MNSLIAESPVLVFTDAFESLPCDGSPMLPASPAIMSRLPSPAMGLSSIFSGGLGLRNDTPTTSPLLCSRRTSFASHLSPIVDITPASDDEEEEDSDADEPTSNYLAPGDPTGRRGRKFGFKLNDLNEINFNFFSTLKNRKSASMDRDGSHSSWNSSVSGDSDLTITNDLRERGAGLGLGLDGPRKMVTWENATNPTVHLIEKLGKKIRRRPTPYPTVCSHCCYLSGKSEDEGRCVQALKPEELDYFGAENQF